MFARPTQNVMFAFARNMVLLSAICLSLGWLVACAEHAEPTRQGAAAVPPPTVVTTIVETLGPTRTPEETATTGRPTETRAAEKSVVAGGVRFIAHPVPIDSGHIDATVAAADFDGDGNQDLLAAGEDRLTLFHGDGRGGLTVYGRAPGGEQPEGFALHDLDEDGDVDMVIANHDTDYLTILLNDGRGDFRPAPNSPLRISVGPHPHVVRAADLDGDGLLDLVVDHREAEGLLILRGLGQGAFETPGTVVPVGGDPYRGMALSDLNGDGRLDLVTPNPKEAGVLLNTGQGDLAFAAAAPVPAAAPFAVELGDINGDGHLDLIAASDEGSPLAELFLGDGQGNFGASEYSPFQLAPGGKSIVVGDFNGDGLSDAAVASYHHREVLLLWGGQEAVLTGALAGGEHPWGLAAADFNGDGLDDLVIADDGADEATLYLSERP